MGHSWVTDKIPLSSRQSLSASGGILWKISIQPLLQSPIETPYGLSLAPGGAFSKGGSSEFQVSIFSKGRSTSLQKRITTPFSLLLNPESHRREKHFDTPTPVFLELIRW
tara:strand:+ start:120 stop:449 length:330 start_codon:yes stop_codon:yes gene_type:complete